jgi:hypothetical protein
LPILWNLRILFYFAYFSEILDTGQRSWVSLKYNDSICNVVFFFFFFVDYCFLIFLGLQFFGISCRIFTNYFLPTIPAILYYPFSKQSTSFLVISMKNLQLICLIQICDFSPTENLRWRPSMLKLFSNNLGLCNYQLWTYWT